MRTGKTLRSGQEGTKELLKCFGSNLLLVRYRYDEQRREQVKTVEMVVRRRSRKRDTEVEGSRSPGARRSGSRRVALRIGWRERDLQRRVKSAGGRWDPGTRVWIVRREVAERLDLLARMVGGSGGT